VTQVLNATSSARLNFYFRNASSTSNRIIITRDSEVSINGTSTARLELYQQSQSVDTGLRFDNKINSDWDVTHSFGLRFHYSSNLRSFINASTDTYTQSSDKRLKTNISTLL